MESQIKQILDSDLEPVKKYRALWRLAEDAEDAGDYEYAKHILAKCDKIISPRTGEPYPSQPTRFPHSYFHARKPQVIVVKEKHGTYYYDASTPENAAKACLAIIEQRLDPDFCWYMDDLPEGVEREDQLDLFKRIKRPLTEKEQAEAIIEMANGNLIRAGKAAAKFLDSRRDYEYEGIEFEVLQVGRFGDKND